MRGGGGVCAWQPCGGHGGDGIGGRFAAAPFRWFWGEQTVQAAREGRRFQPIREQVQFNPREARLGVADETQAVWTVLDDLGARISQFGCDREQESKGGAVRWHLREYERKPGRLA